MRLEVIFNMQISFDPCIRALKNNSPKAGYRLGAIADNASATIVTIS